MSLAINSRLGLLLFTIIVPACGGGAPEETVTRTPPKEQPTQPAPQQETLNATGPGQIVGFVFEDKNRNGTFDANDTRMARRTVLLTNPSASQRIRSATTAADGGFRFDNLAAGDYRVTLEIPEGFERTRDNSFVLTLSADGTPREVQFGIAPQKP